MAARRRPGPASGSGYEIILQGFNWESYRQPWYNVRYFSCEIASLFLFSQKQHYSAEFSLRGPLQAVVPPPSLASTLKVVLSKSGHRMGTDFVMSSMQACLASHQLSDMVKMHGSCCLRLSPPGSLASKSLRPAVRRCYGSRCR